jgi:ribosomal protein S18 acetylase RimI-like enzyme
MDVGLRPYADRDFDFARGLYFDAMRWAIERHFGWDEAHQRASFAGWFKPREVSIIVAAAADVGWMQQRQERDAIFLGYLYVIPSMQGRGIGTHVIQQLLSKAGEQSQAVTLAVMKINRARNLYERLGFRITGEDEYKLYMKADPRMKP